MDRARPSLELDSATVHYGVFTALDRVDFRLFPGEIHSIMGENGAGKSTLIGAMTGALPMTSGRVLIDGQEVQLSSPVDAARHGIAAVYQELDLLPNLSVAENIFLGREPRRHGIIDVKLMRAEAQRVLLDVGVDIDPAAVLGSYSRGIQQIVAIARACSQDARIVVLDEPTSSLDLDEVAELFRVLRELRDRGVAILFVSHFLEQVYEICDRITVLRDGVQVGEYLTTELLKIDLVQTMLGRDVAEFRQRPRELDAEARPLLLSGESLATTNGVRDATMSCAEGEVVGFAGLLGSGRTELARALTGVDRVRAGSVELSGEPVTLSSPHDAAALGVVYSTESRATEGIFSDLSVEQNITLSLQAQRGPWRPLSRARRRELAVSWVEALGIKVESIDDPAGTLSGGNQQKVLLARLLALSPRVLVLDEPTRGIDVGARVEVQNLVGDLADNGLAVIYISADLEEVARVSDRIAVVRDGVVVDEVAADDVNLDSLLALVANPELSTA